MPITSLRNDRLRWVRKLVEERRARRREGLWVAEGLRLAEEVAHEGLPVRLWVVEDGWGRGGGREGALREAAEGRGDPLLEVKRGLLCQVADTLHPQGVVVVFEAPRWEPQSTLLGTGPVLVLDRIQHPGNLGTVARSAEAAGASGLLLTPGTADPGNPKALRASAGSLLRLPTARTEDPVGLVRNARRQVFATTQRGGVPYDRADLAKPFALLLGQEASGLSTSLVGVADLTLTIPMAGRLESLNVAATAAVVLFEAARQRRRGT